MVPRVGQRIGPYEILGRLGSGGMGIVFSAWDARLQRDVAIKLLREEYATPTMRTRFLQEARAASGLNHPNICTVFDIGEVGSDPFLVMELLKGETLRSRIGYGGKLAAEEICRIAKEVLDALVVAHARGIIHRDIKPANIILVNKASGGFQSKVLDFGLAKVDLGEEESRPSDLTTIGTTVGTVSYMSPEQARGEALDARSDLFSLGSVLYEAATGELPFQGATSALVFVELLGKNPTPIRQHNPATPRDLDRFIARLLAKDPADRFPSAGSALEALKFVSLRKSTLGELSAWAKGAGKGKHGQSAGAPGEQDAPNPRGADSPRGVMTASSDDIVRPARRVADPARIHYSPPPPDRSPYPPEPFPPGTPPRPRQNMGEVVVRPIRPDVLQQTPPRELRPGSGSEVAADVPEGGGTSTDGDAGDTASAGKPPSPTQEVRDPVAYTPAYGAIERPLVRTQRPMPIRFGSSSGVESPAWGRRHTDRPERRLPRFFWIVLGLLVVLVLVGLIWFLTSHHEISWLLRPSVLRGAAADCLLKRTQLHAPVG